MPERAAAVAEILSRSLSGRVVLCDLFGAQGGVLEHNVSVEVVARYKRASLDRLTTMTALIQKYLPELGENATLFSLQTMVMAGALSAYSTPSAQSSGGLPGRARAGPVPPEAGRRLEDGPDRNPPGRAALPLTCAWSFAPGATRRSRSTSLSVISRSHLVTSTELIYVNGASLLMSQRRTSVLAAALFVLAATVVQGMATGAAQAVSGVRNNVTPCVRGGPDGLSGELLLEERHRHAARQRQRVGGHHARAVGWPDRARLDLHPPLAHGTARWPAPRPAATPPLGTSPRCSPTPTS